MYGGRGRCSARRSGLRGGGMNGPGKRWRMDWSQPTRFAIGASPCLTGRVTVTQAGAGSWAFRSWKTCTRWVVRTLLLWEYRWTAGLPFVLVPVGDPRLSGVSRCLGPVITHQWASISWNRSTWLMLET